MSQNKAPESSEFAAMLAEFEKEQRTPANAKTRQKPKVGAEVRGRVLSIGRDAVFVDLGGKDDGVLPIDEVRNPDGEITVAVGDEIQARVIEIDGKAGGVVLRRALGRGPDGREELRQAFEHRIPVEGQVTGVVKGGLEISIAGARAFCPISQIELRHVEDASVYVGQKLRFVITRYEEGRSLNLVVSRRSILEEEAQARAVELRQKLKVGAVLRGTVTALKDYGAFVDLGGLEGMLHVSELSFQRARHPKDVLSVGQEIEVQVIKLEKSDDPRKPEKIALSLKSLEQDPWGEVEARFPAGSRVAGQVVRVEQFGAFVELEPGIEGLVHISEMGGNRRHAREVAKIGDTLQVMVLAVDREKRRIALGTGTNRAVEETVDRGALAAVNASGRFGTFGDLLKKASQKK